MQGGIEGRNPAQALASRRQFAGGCDEVRDDDPRHTQAPTAVVGIGERGALDREAVDPFLLVLDVETDNEFPEGSELLDVGEGSWRLRFVRGGMVAACIVGR